MAIPKVRTIENLLLVMGGTEERLQFALGLPDSDGYTLLASRQWTVPGQSVRFLIPGLNATLNEFGVGTEAISKIACVRGPGSFTGLRLVLAAAEGIAAGRNIPLAGLDYLPLLARGPAPLLTGPLHVLTYARRGLVYIQSFDCPQLTEIAPLTALTLDEAAKRISAHGGTSFMVGTGLRKNSDYFIKFAGEHPGRTILPETWDNPTPEIMLELAAQAEYSYDPIEPVYVRPSDAEDNLEQIARKRGLNPEEAQKRLDELRSS